MISSCSTILLNCTIFFWFPKKINIQKSDFGQAIISEPRKYFGPVDITRVRIRLYDEFGRIINMNDTNYSFCLVFNMMYDL